MDDVEATREDDRGQVEHPRDEEGEDDAGDHAEDGERVPQHHPEEDEEEDEDELLDDPAALGWGRARTHQPSPPRTSLT
ncbi:Uncharacterised protein [Mycobacteroides abscessus subsp. abscessus]|nr:Uncharacterised protein [Mycobacteroides abscessus subsp. abscessus]